MAGEPLSAARRAAARAGLTATALGVALARQARAEWYGSPMHLWALGRPQAEGFAAAPRDTRPANAAAGRDLLAGAFVLDDETLRAPTGGDPWNQPSPSRRFATRLHRFGWMRDLLTAGDPGVREALRLTLEWGRVFGRWNGFAWSGEVLERRIFNLAGANRPMAAVASDAEAAFLADSFARQARHLLALCGGADRSAERLAAVVTAGAVLAGRAGDRLMAAGLARLDAALEASVLPDGGHASRSPQAGLELLFDLLALDDALLQRGRPPPESLSRAIDRLTAGLRFFTLGDGRLACFQGGETSTPQRVAAARAHDEAPPDAVSPMREAPHAGYQRLDGPSIQIIADAAAPVTGPLSRSACGQPLAIEIVCGRDRLVTNTGWSPEATGPQALRLAAGGSTVSIGDGVIGAPLGGFLARALGPRLVGGPASVVVNRRESDAGVWIEMAHDGWVSRFGLTHERRLFLDRASGELRGEDRFVPAENATDRLTPVDIHFHLHPDAYASLARDQRSVLLRGPSNVGWWLRNDAGEVTVEPSVHFVDGRPRRTSQVVLRGRLRADRGGRVRWKLAQAELAAS
jgi:uncharacterized heparinase superfamily protein